MKILKPQLLEICEEPPRKNQVELVMFGVQDREIDERQRLTPRHEGENYC